MSYELEITKQATIDIELHKESGDKSILNKLNTLLTELTEHPFNRTGKLEPLKNNLTG
jgi:toxin YoeB